MVVIKIICSATCIPSDVDGSYVKEFDPDARGGRGSVKTTRFIDDALRFINHSDAHEYWMQQSKVRPLRDDGHPNRPLTAYMIEILPLGFLQ